MKNIWKIFQRDVARIWKNVVALVAIMGICVVPSLYAWFNIAASWDPYSNTGNLKVAVASVDEGYEGSLIPIEINVGDQVLSALRGNTQMEWVFTTEEKATNGVKSGKYYAAIVIPEDFSEKMMSVFSEDVEKPEITYYSNAKENAIAPKVTDKGASAVQQQVNEVFIETISDTALTVLQTVSNMTEASGAEEIVANLNTNLNRIADDLTVSAGLLQSFSDLAASADNLIGSTQGFLETARAQSSATKSAYSESGLTISDAEDALDAAEDRVSEAMTSAEDVYKELDTAVAEALADSKTDAGQAADRLDALADQLGDVTDAYTQVRNVLADISGEGAGADTAAGRLLTKMDETIQSQKNLREEIDQAADTLRSAGSDAAEAKEELGTLFDQKMKSLSDTAGDYQKSLEQSLEELTDSLDTSKREISDLLNQLNRTMDGVDKLTGEAGADLEQIETVLTESGDLLTAAADQIQETTTKLDEMQESGDFTELESLITGDKSGISAFLAAPVSLDTHKIYEIENYGSSMAPFYSVLSMWIGGVVLVAMMKVNVSEKCLEGLENVKLYQIYFGRMLTFLVVGLLQSTLIAFGDLFYLKIQCERPMLFLLGCWFTSIVFVNIIYTLTVSLGDIGKAVCIVLLVVQVAGTGGTFPIEVAPSFFQAVYPLLPFTHSMAALRETVGGMYGMDYWIDMGRLAIFLGISLIVGLVLRKPIIRLNDAFTEKLEETKLM